MMEEIHQIKILLIEDSDDDIILLRREFKNLSFKYLIDVVQTETEMINLCDRNEYDVVISDYNLPYFNGLDALKIVRTRNKEIPFILMSGVMGEEIAVEAMKAGASNYILKSNIKRLVPTLEKEIKEYLFFKETEVKRKNSIKLSIEAENKKREAIDLIDRASKMASIGIITASITHEINQPLNAIKLGAEGILLWNSKNDFVIPERIINMIMKISEATDRIDNVVKHMRQLIIDEDKIQYEILNLNDIIRSSLLLIQNKISSNEIVLELHLDNNELLIKGNSIQLELIINNLLQNSIDSINEKNKKNGKVSIKTYKNDNIFLEITDNGMSFDNSIKDYIFDPLFSTKKKKGGTGLGLAIVDTFLKKIDARITADNLNNDGAVFKIEFKKLDGQLI